MDEFIPAFPMPGGDADRYESDPGMSLRDYFAGQAIASLAQFNQGPMFDDDPPGSEVFAKRAYKLADAMMEARKTKAETAATEAMARHYKLLARKVAHGCTDATCQECDNR